MLKAISSFPIFVFGLRRAASTVQFATMIAMHTPVETTLKHRNFIATKLRNAQTGDATILRVLLLILAHFATFWPVEFRKYVCYRVMTGGLP